MSVAMGVVRYAPARLKRYLPAAACALAPAVAVMLLVPAYFGRSVLAFTPAWSDEIDYWREIYTFGHVGFGGGYYAVNEIAAPVSLSHFGAHGPAFSLLLGPIAALFGWGAASGPILNFAFLFAAMLGYFYLIRAGAWQLAVATLSIMVFWPVLLYIPSTMQETLHQALAVMLAGVFSVLLKKRDQAERWVFVSGVVALSVASLLRPTWAPLFIPLFLFRARATTWREAVRAIALAAPIVVIAFAAGVAFSSPYPNFLSDLLQTTEHAPLTGAHLFVNHLLSNTQLLLLGGEPLERGLRYEMLAVVAVALGLVGYQIYRRRKGPAPASELDTLSLFHILNIVPVLLISLAFYDIAAWRDFRVFAPHVLLSILVSIPFGRRWFVFAPLALNLALLVAFVPTFQSFHEPHFAVDTVPGGALATAVQYQPGASPWRNTVLVDGANYTAQLLLLPPGIGVSVILDPSDLTPPIKSHYLLVSDETMKLLGNPAGWQAVMSTPSGTLYVREGG